MEIVDDVIALKAQVAKQQQTINALTEAVEQLKKRPATATPAKPAPAPAPPDINAIARQVLNQITPQVNQLASDATQRTIAAQPQPQASSNTYTWFAPVLMGGFILIFVALGVTLFNDSEQPQPSAPTQTVTTPQPAPSSPVKPSKRATERDRPRSKTIPHPNRRSTASDEELDRRVNEAIRELQKELQEQKEQ